MAAAREDLVLASINYHGQQLSLLMEDRNPKLMTGLNVRNLDFHAYQSRGKELSGQDRMKRLKLLNFISTKAEVLFAPVPTEQFAHTPHFDDDELIQSQLPNLGSVMKVQKGDVRDRAASLLRVGDVVLCEVVGCKPNGNLLLSILAIITCDCMVLPKTYLLRAQMLAAHSKAPPFWRSRDQALAVVLETVQGDSTFLTFRDDFLSANMVGKVKLGAATFNDLPVRCKKALLDEKCAFDVALQRAVSFYNPNNLHAMAEQQHVSSCDSSLMTHLKSGFSIESCAEGLRKAQASRWAYKSVTKGVTHFKNGEFNEAFQCLNQALSIDPNNVDGLVARGALFANRGNYEKAIIDFESALKEDSDHCNAKKYMGETLIAQAKVYEDEKEYDRAMEVYNLSLSFVPDNKEALSSIRFLKALQSGKIPTSGSLDLGDINIPQKQEKNYHLKRKVLALLDQDKPSSSKKRSKKKHRRSESSSTSDSENSSVSSKGPSDDVDASIRPKSSSLSPLSKKMHAMQSMSTPGQSDNVAAPVHGINPSGVVPPTMQMNPYHFYHPPPPFQPPVAPVHPMKTEEDHAYEDKVRRFLDSLDKEGGTTRKQKEEQSFRHDVWEDRPRDRMHRPILSPHTGRFMNRSMETPRDHWEGFVEPFRGRHSPPWPGPSREHDIQRKLSESSKDDKRRSDKVNRSSERKRDRYSHERSRKTSRSSVEKSTRNKSGSSKGSSSKKKKSDNLKQESDSFKGESGKHRSGSREKSGSHSKSKSDSGFKAPSKVKDNPNIDKSGSKEKGITDTQAKVSKSGHVDDTQKTGGNVSDDEFLYGDSKEILVPSVKTNDTYDPFEPTAEEMAGKIASALLLSTNLESEDKSENCLKELEALRNQIKKLKEKRERKKKKKKKSKSTKSRSSSSGSDRSHGDYQSERTVYKKKTVDSVNEQDGSGPVKDSDQGLSRKNSRWDTAKGAGGSSQWNQENVKVKKSKDGSVRIVKTLEDCDRDDSLTKMKAVFEGYQSTVHIADIKNKAKSTGKKSDLKINIFGAKPKSLPAVGTSDPVQHHAPISSSASKTSLPSERNQPTARSRSRSRRSRSGSRQDGRPPGRYSRSPEGHSRSPRRNSRSPRRRSRSPRRDSRSPRRYSRSPRRCSRSPRRYSRSPRRYSRSPRRYSRSPERHSRSPVWRAHPDFHSQRRHNPYESRSRSRSPNHSGNFFPGRWNQRRPFQHGRGRGRFWRPFRGQRPFRGRFRGSNQFNPLKRDSFSDDDHSAPNMFTMLKEAKKKIEGELDKTTDLDSNPKDEGKLMGGKWDADGNSLEDTEKFIAEKMAEKKKDMVERNKHLLKGNSSK